MGHTTRTGLGTDYEANYAGNQPVICYRGDFVTTNVTPYTWYGWDLTTPFEYNGRDNVIVDVEWMRRTGGPAMVTYGAYRAAGCVYAVGVTPYEPAVYDYVHYMRATINVVGVSPSSLGRVRALYR